MRRGNETRICVTVKSLLRPDKILGQIKMEESLGNGVYIYPGNHNKLAGYLPILSGEQLGRSLDILGRVYTNYGRSWRERRDVGQALCSLVQRVEDPALLVPVLTLLADTDGVIDLTQVQEEYLINVEPKVVVGSGPLQASAFQCALRTRDLKNKPHIPAAVWNRTADHLYLLAPIFRKYGVMYPDKAELLETIRVVWNARVQASTPVARGELDLLLNAVEADATVTYGDGTIHIELKPEEKTNEETKAT